ncbi:hypothetical protein ACP70R_003286 [Stipagrostis hirtigluma subsp. patula]
MACCIPWPRPRPPPRATELETTTSTCAAGAVRRRHVFEIQGYRSLLCRVAAGDFVRSDAFEVGGRHWAVRFYPHGSNNSMPGYVSAFVELQSTPAGAGAPALASCDVAFLPWSPAGRWPPRLAASLAPTLFRPAVMFGWPSFVTRRKLEAPAYLRDDAVRIECAVTVFMPPTNSGTRPMPPPPAPRVDEAPPPPTEMSSRLAKLLDPDAIGAPPPDVFFVVGAETFVAHSFVLWLRCRKLYDQSTASSYCGISSSDVRPAVFKALLHYIYTEALPAMDEFEAAGQKGEMLRRLRAAAEMFEMEKLKLECERSMAGC